MKDGCQDLWVKVSLSLTIANLQPSFILPDGVCICLIGNCHTIQGNHLRLICHNLNESHVGKMNL